MSHGKLRTPPPPEPVESPGDLADENATLRQQLGAHREAIETLNRRLIVATQQRDQALNQAVLTGADVLRLTDELNAARAAK